MAVLLAAIAFHVWRSREELASVQRLSLQMLVGTGLVQLLSQVLLNGSLLLPLRTCLKALGFWELYVVRTGGLFLGSLVPVAGGLAVRLAYLKSRGITYADFTWATLFTNVLGLSAAAVLGVAATGLLWITAGRVPAAIIGISAAVLITSVAAVATFELIPRITRHQRLQKWRWLSSMSSLTTSRGMAGSVFGLSLGRHVANFVTFGLLYQSLSGGPHDFLAGGVVYALTSPVRIVMITPGNVGVAEWVVALVGKVLAFDVTTGLIVALAFRGVALVAQIAGALFGSASLALGRRPS